MQKAKEIFAALRNGCTSEIALDVADLIQQICEAGIGPLTMTAPVVQIHPLGFLCLRWEISRLDSLRIHIWDKNFKCVQSPNWPIHDHVFSFRSVVLFGAVQNKTYLEANVPERRQWNLFEVVYESGLSKLLWTGIQTGIVQASALVQRPGSHYDVAAGMLHRSILRSDFAVTALATSTDAFSNARPRVVGDKTTHSLKFNRDVQRKTDVVLLMRKSVELLAGKPYKQEKLSENR